MSYIKHYPKSDQEIQILFDGAFIENKPISFPNAGLKPYSNLFYWAHLSALESAEFPLHPHKGFEIMTFVFEGSLEHYDTATKVWTPINAGGLQVTQSGSGVYHSERITQGTKLFQIWFDPDFKHSLKLDAAYQDYTHLKSTQSGGIETLNYVGGDSLVKIQTKDIEVRKLKFDVGSYTLETDEDSSYSIYILNGHGVLNKQYCIVDDFLILTQSKIIQLEVEESLELFMIKSPTHLSYKTY